MPGKMALVDYNKCKPEICNNGICPAALRTVPPMAMPNQAPSREYKIIISHKNTSSS